MQTRLDPRFSTSPSGLEAEAILRKCVHCGFCNATCPTYQLLGDERDGPRGRIYLMKQLFEGEQSGSAIALHLDRCLTCRNCETTCPSGVEYARLLELGRAALADSGQRSHLERLTRSFLSTVLKSPICFGVLLKVGILLRPLLPRYLRDKIPVTDRMRISWPKPRHSRKMVALGGCVQGTLAPNINAATARVLDRMGISLLEVPGAGCCGALDLHTTDERNARKVARRLIDAWMPHIHETEAYVMTASGCGVSIKEYPRLFERDPVYREKAQAIAEKTFDLCEILEREPDLALKVEAQGARVAFHPPCTLQHGQKLAGRVERILAKAGYALVPVRDAHLCCGSAGTYSLLQPQISGKLKSSKLSALYEHAPDMVCTANIGCQVHLSVPDHPPVRHWIELLL